MSRITTKTGVANLAASLLKTNRVSNIDPPETGSKFAKAASLWYDESRRVALAQCVWNFAKKRIQISEDATAPDFGYGARYLLPSDYIRVATLGDENDPEKDYVIEDGYLLCNLTSPINLVYIYDQEDILKFSPMFTQLLARELAANTAYEISGNRTLAKEMRAEVINYLSDAMGIDGQESPPPNKIRRSKWKAAKEGYAFAGSDYSGRVVT